MENRKPVFSFSLASLDEIFRTKKLHLGSHFHTQPSIKGKNGFTRSAR